MAMALPAQVIEKELTFEDYMSEGEINRRYDIIDGKREYMTNPSVRHQEVAGNIYDALRTFQKSHRFGRTIMAPCDILISRKPLRTRQPDALFISRERFGDKDPKDPAPLPRAPELVVEVLSPSEGRSARLAKVKDYCKAGVLECWIVSPQAETVEVLRLTQIAHESVEVYGHDQTVTSIAFPDLSIKVADIFAFDE
jgi:Uma2 family endonuclease